MRLYIPPLKEFEAPAVRTVLRPPIAKPPTLKGLENDLYNDAVIRYQREARKVAADLGSEDFELTAQWKRQQLKSEANAKAKALVKSYAAEEKRLASAHPNKRDREKAWRQFTQRKASEYDDLAQAEASMNARVDMLVQSGAVDPDKSKVMVWTLVGPNTCPICFALDAGNPYTIQRATTLGAKAHPGCVDGFVSDWEADPALVKETKRKVADGEMKLWDGGSSTPARSSAPRLQAMMQPAQGGWKGRQTQQRRVASSAGIGREELDDQLREYARANRQR